jgi:hypothetical protein
VPHPRDGSVLLDAGEGQDGSSAFLAREQAGALVVEPRLQDVVVAGFDAAGARLLLLPHPSFDNVARVVAWPTLDEIAALEGQQRGLEHFLDFYGFFLGSGRVLLSTGEGPPVLCTAGLDPIAYLDLRGTSLGDDVEMVSMLGLGEEMFGAQLWADGVTIATAWRVPG